MRDNMKHKWKRFADEYLLDMNASRAYVAAGYSSKTPDKNAYKMLDNEEIKEYIKAKQTEYRKSLDIDKQKMLDMLMSEINLFNEIKALAQKDDLTEEEEFKFARLTTLLKASDINKARDMINKLIGAYEAEKQEITHKGITINVIKPDDNKL